MLRNENDRARKNKRRLSENKGALSCDKRGLLRTENFDDFLRKILRKYLEISGIFRIFVT